MDAMVKVPYDATVRLMLASLERNLLPDAVIRRLTRLLLAARLRSGYKPSAKLQLSDLLQFVHCTHYCFIVYTATETQCIACSTFTFSGAYKNSVCCYFKDKLSTLEDAEKAMMELYCERLQLKDGHTVLDIGCGWGSLSLYIAQKYSSCKVTGICNSVTQKAYIEEQCRELQLGNLEIIVADISTFEMEGSYDRILSIEMFEHMKNYGDLLKKISRWMKPDSLLFVHHFCHKAFAYHFEDVNDDDWITRYFFSGGTMPSADLLLYFQDDVSVVNHWLVNGKHYAQTSEEWLKRMDQNKKSIKPIMESTYGKDSAVKWTVYWRTFFISVAELFGYNNGEEWMVAHFLFKKK
ncbi:hypothetical protein RND71_043106 [Anisodus tanguticus]|uniref:(S)-coclaurine N-methyltransferase-like n=1 Tax=Anisodus tanguticus TaxID=243964 RepID=A0AAE1UVE4_9SOLA|nr:hypothetical protein RND71_043106 [Anisodus tanguticus]